MGVPRTLAKGLSKLKEAAELRKLGGAQAERMARAAEQGYDTSRTLYHGGANDFDAFAESRRGVYLSDNPDIAGIYADNAQKRWPGQNNAEPNIIAGYVKGKPLVVSDQGAGGGGWLSDNMAKALNVSLDDVPTMNRAAFLNDEARRQGYGYVEIQNMDDLGGNQTQIRLLDNSNFRSVNADFNPEYRDSSNLLAGIAGVMPYAGATAAALAGATGSQDAEAGPLQTLGRATPYLTSAALGGAAALQSPEVESFVTQPVIDPSYEAYIRDEMEARTAADKFTQMRGSKAGYWEARRQELLDMVNGLGEMANNVVLPALDKPLQGYLGLAGTLGTLASGGGFEQAIQAGARNATQPIDQTTYGYGGAVTDALSPYTTPEAAAAAGALVHGGIQIASPF